MTIKKYKYYFVMVMLCHSLYACAQTKTIPNDTLNKPTAATDSSYTAEKFIPGNYSNFKVDILENIYFITAGNQLKKISAQGDSLAVYNNVKKYGTLTQIDVSNPLKILLYYQNFSTLVILNRQLTFLSSLNFRSLGLFSISTVAASYDNNIWVFDEQDFTLKKLNEAGKLLQQTVDLRSSFSDVPIPIKIIDQDNFVYLYDPAKGFYIFDYYGGFKNHLPFLNWSQVAVFNKTLYGFLNNRLHTYPLNTLQTQTYSLPVSLHNYKAIQILNGKIYILKDDGLHIYWLK